MRKLLTLATVLAVTLSTAVVATAEGGGKVNENGENSVTLAVYGDSPYGPVVNDQMQIQATPAFIDSINRDMKVDLVLHVGDIHSGSDHCTEAYNNKVKDLWKMFKNPLVYTPGDNEWTDCQKAKEGGWTYTAATTASCTAFADEQTNCNGYYDSSAADHEPGDPLDNLALVRRIFFPNPGTTLGGRKKKVLSQALADPNYPDYVENVMWEESKVLFVTVNIPGGSNNDTDVWYKSNLTKPPADPAWAGDTKLQDRQDAERKNRTEADLRWLDAAFAQAKKDRVQAVLIGTQADMWDLDGKNPDHIKNYLVFIDSIASHATAFGGPVLLFNGDSHVYRSDNPLVSGAPCFTEASSGSPDVVNCLTDAYATQKPNLPQSKFYNVPNFHRVVVHGSTFPLEWLKLTINPRANNEEGSNRASKGAGPNTFGPFSWERRIVVAQP